jgi:hypothetical protein
MIVTEEYNAELKKTYSNENLYIRKVGTEEIYDIAIDLKTATFEYEETDEPIEVIPDAE